MVDQNYQSMWQHFEGDTFSFYEKLINGTGLAELQANFEDNDLNSPVTIKRSKMVKGIYSDAKDEKQRIKHYSSFSANEVVENLKGIERLVEAEKTEEAQKQVVKGAISKIDFYLAKLSKSKIITEHYSFFITDLQQLKEDIILKFSYLMPEQNTVVQANTKSIPKIQWLGKTNVLATLLYDLWQGQDKGSKAPSSKPLIKAQKKDLEQLLVDNFIDAKGKPLTIATISDYLNTSKPEKRAKKGTRIEL